MGVEAARVAMQIGCLEKASEQRLKRRGTSHASVWGQRRQENSKASGHGLGVLRSL